MEDNTLCETVTLEVRVPLGAPSDTVAEVLASAAKGIRTLSTESGWLASIHLSSDNLLSEVY